MVTQSEETLHFDSDTIDYRPVSRWAVVALLLGIASAAAIMGPMLWFIPAAGILASMLAMKSMIANNRVSGWNLALLGLVLCMFFGAAGPARTVSKRIWLETRGKEFVAGFLDLVARNQPFAAHQLSLPTALRRSLGNANPADPYEKDEKGKQNYNAFLAHKQVKALLENGSHARIEIISSRYLTSDDHGDYVDVRFRIDFPETDASAIEASSIAEHSVAYDTRAEQWRIVPPGFNDVESNK